MTDPVVYRSHARIERIKGPLRRAYLPAAKQPVLFGLHSEVAEHYDVAERVHGFHAEYCPLARSISGCVNITTSLELEELEDDGR